MNRPRRKEHSDNGVFETIIFPSSRLFKGESYKFNDTVKLLGRGLGKKFSEYAIPYEWAAEKSVDIDTLSVVHQNYINRQTAYNSSIIYQCVIPRKFERNSGVVIKRFYECYNNDRRHVLDVTNFSDICNIDQQPISSVNRNLVYHTSVNNILARDNLLTANNLFSSDKIKISLGDDNLLKNDRKLAYDVQQLVEGYTEAISLVGGCRQESFGKNNALDKGYGSNVCNEGLYLGCKSWVSRFFSKTSCLNKIASLYLEVCKFNASSINNNSTTTEDKTITLANNSGVNNYHVNDAYINSCNIASNKSNRYSILLSIDCLNKYTGLETHTKEKANAYELLKKIISSYFFKDSKYNCLISDKLLYEVANNKGVGDSVVQGKSSITRINPIKNEAEQPLDAAMTESASALPGNIIHLDSMLSKTPAIGSFNKNITRKKCVNKERNNKSKYKETYVDRNNDTKNTIHKNIGRQDSENYWLNQKSKVYECINLINASSFLSAINGKFGMKLKDKLKSKLKTIRSSNHSKDISNNLFGLSGYNVLHESNKKGYIEYSDNASVDENAYSKRAYTAGFDSKTHGLYDHQNPSYKNQSDVRQDINVQRRSIQNSMENIIHHLSQRTQETTGYQKDNQQALQEIQQQIVEVNRFSTRGIERLQQSLHDLKGLLNQKQNMSISKARPPSFYGRL